MSHANQIQSKLELREAPPLAPECFQPTFRREASFRASMALCGQSTGEFITRSGFGTAASPDSHYSSTADCNEVRALGRLDDAELAEQAGCGSRGRYVTLMMACSALLVPLFF